MSYLCKYLKDLKPVRVCLVKSGFIPKIYQLLIKSGFIPNKPKMAYSRDALLENSKRQERDKTRVNLERD